MPLLWWFAETTIVAGVLALAAWSLGRWKRLGLGPGARHLLWLVVLVKLLTPPVVSWPKREAVPVTELASKAIPSQPDSRTLPASSVPNQAPRTTGAAKPVARPPSSKAPSPPPDAFDEAWASFEAPGQIPSPRVVAKSSEPRHNEDKARTPLAAAPTTASAAQSAAPKPPATPASPPAPPLDLSWLVPIALGLWALGSVGMAMLQGVRIAQFSRRLRFASVPPSWLVEDVGRISAALRATPPRILVVAGLGGPMLWCLGRATLLVPRELIDRLRGDRWPGVLTHELAHLRRRDHWVARMELLAELIWWWNPIYHITRRRLREEAELASDAWVVRVGPEAEERRRYAEALVDVCEHLSRLDESRGAALKVGVAGSAKALEGRLLMILREVNPKPTPGRWALAAAVLALLSLPAWSAAPQKKEEPPKGKPLAVPKADRAIPPRKPIGEPTGIPIPQRPASAKPETLPNAPTGPIAAQEVPARIDPPRAAPSTPSNPVGEDPWQNAPIMPDSPTPDVGSGGTRLLDRSDVLQSFRTRAFAARDLDSRVSVWRERRTSGESPTGHHRLVSVQTARVSLGEPKSFVIDRVGTGSEVIPPREGSAPEWYRLFSYSDGLQSQILFMRPPTSKAIPRSLDTLDPSLPYQDLNERDCVARLQGLFRPEVSDGLIRINEVVPGQAIDGTQTVKMAIEYEWKMGVTARETLWLAPSMGWAVVRSDSAIAPNSGNGHSLVLRSRLRDFTESGGVFVARRIEAVADVFDADARLVSRTRTRAQVDRLKVNAGLAPGTFDIKLAARSDTIDNEGDGPATAPLSEVETTPTLVDSPAMPEGLLEALRDAVSQCPFGPPGDRPTLPGTRVVPAPRESLGHEAPSPSEPGSPARPPSASPIAPVPSSEVADVADSFRSGTAKLASAPKPGEPPHEELVPIAEGKPLLPSPSVDEPRAPAPPPEPVEGVASAAAVPTPVLPQPVGEELSPIPAARPAEPKDRSAASTRPSGEPGLTAARTEPSIGGSPAIRTATDEPTLDPVKAQEAVPIPNAATSPSPSPIGPALPSPARSEALPPPASERTGPQPGAAAAHADLPPSVAGVESHPGEVAALPPSPVEPSPGVLPSAEAAEGRPLPTVSGDQPALAPTTSQGENPPPSLAEVSSPLQPPSPQPATALTPAAHAPDAITSPPATEPGRAPEPSRDPFSGGVETTIDLISQRDQIELLETRLPARRAELEAAEVKLAIALEKLTSTEKLKAKGMISSGEAGISEGASKIAKAERDQKAAELREAELMVTQAKRRYARDEARVKREIERMKDALGGTGAQTSVGALYLRQNQQRLELLLDQLPDSIDAEKATPSDIRARKEALGAEISKVMARLKRHRQTVRNDSDPVIQAALKELDRLRELARKLDWADSKATSAESIETERIEGRPKTNARSAPVQ